MPKTYLFVTNVIFWIILLITFSFVGQTVDTSAISQGVVTSSGDYRDELTVKKLDPGNLDIFDLGNGVTFIFKLMFWQIDPALGVPHWLMIFLDVFAVFSIYIFVDALRTWIRGG